MDRFAGAPGSLGAGAPPRRPGRSKGPYVRVTCPAAAERAAAAAVETELGALIRREYSDHLTHHRAGSGRRSLRHHLQPEPKPGPESPVQYASSVTVSRLLASREHLYSPDCGGERGRLVARLAEQDTARRAIREPCVPCPPPRGEQRRACALASAVMRRSPDDADDRARIPSPPVTGMRQLPGEMFVHAFTWLTFRELCRVSLVRRSWFVSSDSDCLWRAVSRVHSTDIQPQGDQSWKMAFRDHVCAVRAKLDTELRGLEDKVKRADRTLARTHQQLDAAAAAAAAPAAAAAAAEPAAPSSRSAEMLQRTVQAEGAAQAAQRRLDEQSRVLGSLQYAARDREQQLAALADEVGSLTAQVARESTLAARRTFLSRFQAHVVRACFIGCGEVPIAIRRGTETFSQMEALAATYGGPDSLWRRRWQSLSRLFPLSDAWWTLHDDLLDGADGGPPDAAVSVTSVRGYSLQLRYPKGSKRETLVRLMADMLGTPLQELSSSLTSSAASR
eukprot:TRINITY_DN2565_c0_g1_i1.p1 TRINITY_DN2565_c0_g1~~TRINITY_DN2565_c0_g1_i1.p1  ORF type:complete len:529 (+),score=195.00 TRINITY_DN2565_c0_g1_i1:74-1588(+)